MSKSKKQWRINRKNLKIELSKLMNNGIAMAIIKTYSAYKHRAHIHAFWYLLRNYKDAHKEYNEKLFGKMLCGEDEIYNTLYFIDKNLVNKYRYKVPERLALGDAYNIALTFLKRNKCLL
jgi:hypothetical protein